MDPPDLPPAAPPAPTAPTPWWYYPLMVALICGSALFSGLTLGLMSFDESQLQIIIAGDDRRQRMYAEKILPIRRRGNMLLCTLLLGNTLVNSVLAILVDGVSWLAGPIGVAATTTFILIFGEIIPQSFCSRHGLVVGYYTSEVVKIVMLLLAVVAWPLSKMLDCALGEELGTQYSRTELKQLFSMQVQNLESDQLDHGDVENKAAVGLSRYGTMGNITAVAEPEESLRSRNRGIRPAEASWLCGVLSLSERTAEEIMTPLCDVFRIYEDDVLDFELMRKIADSGHSRIPVLKRSAASHGVTRHEAHPDDRHSSDGPGALPAGQAGNAESGAGEDRLFDIQNANGDFEGDALPADTDPAGISATRRREAREHKNILPFRASRRNSRRDSKEYVYANSQGDSSSSRGTANGYNSQEASRSVSPPGKRPSSSEGQDGRRTIAEWPPTARSNEVVGLLSSKDLLLMDPENAVPVAQMLKYCSRAVVTAWFDTPVAQLFRDFKRGHSHLAMIQRVNDGGSEELDGSSRDAGAQGVSDPFYEVVGIVTLEDVLEELLGAEIVDESDVYTDNVTRGAVEGRREEIRRRGAWQNMLDPSQVSNLEISSTEIEVISLFLAANVPLLSTLPQIHLHALLRDSKIAVLDGGETAPPIYMRGQTCDCCTVVLQGRLHTRVECGSEVFEGERGPWSTLAVQSLSSDSYVADFTARPIEPTRVLRISRESFEIVSGIARQEAEKFKAIEKANQPTCSALPVQRTHALLTSVPASPRSTSPKEMPLDGIGPAVELTLVASTHSRH